MVNNKNTAVLGALQVLMKHEKYWDKWICDLTLFKELIQSVPALTVIGITVTELKRLISRSYGLSLESYGEESINDIGLFSYTVRTICPVDKGRRRVTYYCITKAGCQPSSGRPKGNSFPNLGADEEFMSNVETRCEKKEIERWRLS